MADDDRKAAVLPLGITSQDTFTGLVLDEQGARPVEFHRVKDGDTDDGDRVSFQPLAGSPLLEARFHSRSGPAQVATPAYAAGWDRIFGKQPAAEA